MAHAALIAPGTYLTPESDGAPFEFLPGGEPSKIRVIPFYKMVKAGWDAFDKRLLKPESQLAHKHYRATPVNLTGSTAVSIAASGSRYVAKPI